MDRRPLAGSRVRAGAFALELATLGVSSKDEDIRADALDVLLGFHDLVRHPIGPDAFECRWYTAEVTALSIGLNTGAAERAAAHALERCPADGSLALGRAIAADQFWSTDSGREHGGDVLRREVTTSASVMKRYDAAMAFPAAAFEARVRAAWLAFRMGDLQAATARLNETAAPPDRVLLYFRHLIRGQVLREQKQPEAAVQAFRDALAAWPSAQAARVSLMSSLAVLGHQSEASSWPSASRPNRPGRSIRGGCLARSVLRLARNRSPAHGGGSVTRPRRPAIIFLVRFSAAAIGLVPLTTIAQEPPAGSPQTFRSQSSGIYVDVSVRQGARPVTNLTAADFLLLDNGVPQEIAEVSSGDCRSTSPSCST